MKRKRGCLGFALGFAGFFIIVGIIGSSGSREVKESPSTPQKVEETVVEEKVSQEPLEYTFSNGNYTCGEDFEAGKYDITLVEGTGNVICIEGGLNMMAGNQDGFQTEFKNANFRKGYELQIMNVTIKMVRK